MSSVRKMRNKYQGLVRVTGHPNLAKTFSKFSDAQQFRLALETGMRQGEFLRIRSRN